MGEKKYKDIGEGAIQASKRRIVRRHRKVEDSRVYRRSSFVVSLLFGTIALGVIAVTLVVYNMRREQPVEGEVAETLDELRKNASEQFESTDEEVAERVLSTEETAAQVRRVAATVTSLTKASTYEDLLPLIINPDQHGEAIKEYLVENTVFPIRVLDSGQAVIDGRVFAVLKAKVGLRNSVLIVDMETAKVDWESMIGYNCFDYAEILKRAPKPEGVAIRCSLRMGPALSYYNYDYDDSDQWLSLTATHPEFERSLYVYLDKRSDTFAKFLEDFFPRNQAREKLSSPATIIIQATSQEALDRNQFEIKEIISDSWFIPNSSEIADLNPSEEENAEDKDRDSE